MRIDKTLSRDRAVQGVINFPVRIALILFIAGAITQGCQKSDSRFAQPSSSSPTTGIDFKITDSSQFTSVYLVSDDPGLGALNIDSQLVNAWGMAISDENEIWVSSNEEGLSLIYNHEGQKVDTPVTIPGDTSGSAPTGAVYNETTDFVIASTGETSEFIFSTEAGTIAAWASGDSAIIVADRSAEDAVYKGIAIASNNGVNYLYATNFKGNAVDVFDASFNYVSSITFTDPTLPAGYAPFNIKSINGQLYVTYALQLGPDNEDDDAGPGHGYVDIYNTDGTFVTRFASEGSLNSPWGIEQVPGNPTAIMIGNFGDGRINVFDSTGTWVTNLQSNGSPIEIPGLWALGFIKKPSGDDRKRLYFTAGPADESHGLFGYIKVNP